MARGPARGYFRFFHPSIFLALQLCRRLQPTSGLGICVSTRILASACRLPLFDNFLFQRRPELSPAQPALSYLFVGVYV